MNACVRKTAAKFGDKPDERLLLSLGASVLWRFAGGGTATDIANANRIGVMPYAMSTDFLNCTSLMDAAVEINHEVIAYAPEATLPVPGIDVVDREGFAFRCRGTMNDNFANVAHFRLHSEILSKLGFLLLARKFSNFSHFSLYL